MARYTGSVCRLCRREGEKLFLKGNRCSTEKCAFERRAYAPGQHGQKRPRTSNYGIQLREKQKVKRMYGLLEAQFKNLFAKAVRIKGVTGENFMILLERRLDNAVFRANLAISRNQARQLVSHGHVTVNGNKVNVPSYLLNSGDVVSVRESSREIVPIKAAIESGREIPQWLSVDAVKLTAQLVALPSRDTITMPIQEQLIVEFFSK